MINSIIEKLPAWKTFKNADDWIFPAGLDAKHWNIPESMVIKPNIFKLVLKQNNVTNLDDSFKMVTDP